MDEEILSDIHNKLTLLKTTLEKLAKGEEVSKGTFKLFEPLYV